MGSQDQHRENEPQTAAEAFAKAAELEQAAADSSDRDAIAEQRGEASRLRHKAGLLRRDERRQERREKTRKDAAAIDAMRAGHGSDAA
ncbi:MULTISPECIES: hypothetical protein [unclassified Streptomyces]|uniref:hypothetical protein n=1 Tax=unclassified Streptomyces TaxID=2593676 RepID=UPI002E1896D6